MKKHLMGPASTAAAGFSLGLLLVALCAGSCLASPRGSWLDVSVPVEEGKTPIYSGDPSIHFSWAKSMDKGDVANVSELQFGAHTGTHIDAPSHFIPGGATIDKVALDRVMGPALVVDMGPDVALITLAELNKHRWQGAQRILFKTRNSYRHLYDDPTFHTDFVAVAPDAAKVLAEHGVVLVGIDYNSIEQFGSKEPLTHRTLLSKDIVIVEGLDLRNIDPGHYDIICVPLKLVAREASPVRALLRRTD